MSAVRKKRQEPGPKYRVRRGYRYRGRVSVEQYDKAVELAAATSIGNASRLCGISEASIRHEMVARGVPRRRPGNFTLQEIDAMKGALVF